MGASGVAFALPGDNPKGDETREALPDGSASKGMITPRTDQAIDRGLSYLYEASRGRVPGSFGTGAYAGNVAVTSLAALAFMAAGNQPNRGPYGRIVLDALRYVLAQENRRPGGHPGFLHNPMDSSHGPMYGHGFGTLFLAEVSGMVHDRALRQELDAKLHRAVNLILISQNSEGGWRYDPEPRPAPHDADISVTICQIMALRTRATLALPCRSRRWKSASSTSRRVRMGYSDISAIKSAAAATIKPMHEPPPASSPSTAPGSTRGRRSKRGWNICGEIGRRAL